MNMNGGDGDMDTTGAGSAPVVPEPTFGSGSGGATTAWNLEAEELALDVMESCPRGMDPKAYIRQLKDKTINIAKEKVAFKKLLQEIKAPSTQGASTSSSGSKCKEFSKAHSVKVDFAALAQMPLAFNKLQSTVTGLTVRRERFLAQDSTKALAVKNKLALEKESLYFLRALSTGVVELLEYTLGSLEERQAAQPGKRFRAVPDEFRKVILDACSCMVYTLHNCYREDRNFDSELGGVNYFVNFLLDYLVVNRVGEDSASGRTTFEFVSQVMEKLRTTAYQVLFLKGLLALIKSTFSQITLVHMNENKKGILGMALIDSLFFYFQLVENLLLAVHNIDEASLLTLKSFERLSLTALAGFPLITIYAARIASHAQNLFNKLEAETPQPPKRKLGDKRLSWN